MSATAKCEDEVTARYNTRWDDKTQPSPSDVRPANDQTVAYLHAYDVYALHQEQIRAMQRRAYMLRCLILAIPEAEWPSRCAR